MLKSINSIVLCNFYWWLTQAPNNVPNLFFNKERLQQILTLIDGNQLSSLPDAIGQSRNLFIEIDLDLNQRSLFDRFPQLQPHLIIVDN